MSIDRIMASIVPIMSTKLAIPYRVIYMLPIHISIHIDNVALVWSQHQTCLSGGVIISAVFLICCCYLFSSFLSWGNCMGSCSWPTFVSPNFVTPQPTFSRPHYVILYEAEKTWAEVWQVHKMWVESGHAPKGVVFCFLSLYVPNISSAWPICMIPSMLVSLMAAISGTFSAKYCKT